MKNYISISGVTDNDELREIHRIYNQEGLSFQLVIGYQASHKSVNQNTQNSRQPRFFNLGGLCESTLEYGFLPAVHYYTKNNNTVLSDLKKIKNVGVNSFSTLLQLNTLPLSRNTLSQIQDMGFGIIFKAAVADKQASNSVPLFKRKGIQDVSSGEITPLINQITERKDVIDYVMFDPSHGRNLDLVLDENSMAVRFGKEIITDERLRKIGLVYAGGINPDNVLPVMQSLNSFFPGRISIDSESGLRTPCDVLDMICVRKYLVNCQRAITSHNL